MKVHYQIIIFLFFNFKMLSLENPIFSGKIESHPDQIKRITFQSNTVKLIIKDSPKND